MKRTEVHEVTIANIRGAHGEAIRAQAAMRDAAEHRGELIAAAIQDPEQPTAAEIATALGVSRARVYAMAAEG